MVDEEHKLDDEIEEIKNDLNKIKSEKEYNPLYLVTFQNKEDYEKIYDKYPHSYLKQAIKNICGKIIAIYTQTKFQIPKILLGKISNLIRNIDISKINSKIME